MGIVEKTKPGWSGLVKNKEVLILQVPYEGLEKNTGNRSCERGNDQTHTVFMIWFLIAPKGVQRASALCKTESLASEKTEVQKWQD